MKRIVSIPVLFVLLASAAAWASHPVADARYTGTGMIHVTLSDGTQMDVPDNMRNWHRRQLAEWEAEGHSIAAYVPPPPLTGDQRIDQAFPASDRERVLFEALFELTNRVIALEGGWAIDRSQLHDWLKAKLPAN